MSQYVEQRDGYYYVAGTRIGLDSIVYCLKEGKSPESILRSFPGVESVENVRGIIAFCQANMEAVEAYLKEGERLFEELKKRYPATPGSLREKLIRAKESTVPQ